MFRLSMFCTTQEDLNRIKIPQTIPNKMTLEEYNRLKSLNSSLGSTHQRLDSDITLGYVDYSAGLRDKDEIMQNINKVRTVLRHFEKEMISTHQVNSGLDDGKQLHVYEFGISGPGTRMTVK